MSKNIIKNKGFTLIEILISIGLLVAIASLTAPFAISLYNNQIIRSVSDEVVSALKKAQAFSLYRRADAEYGVVFSDSMRGTMTLIKSGDSSFDEETDLYEVEFVFSDPSPNLNTIYFEKGRGIPDWEGTITLNRGSVSVTIAVCESGTIEIADDCLSD